VYPTKKKKEGGISPQGEEVVGHPWKKGEIGVFMKKKGPTPETKEKSIYQEGKRDSHGLGK